MAAPVLFLILGVGFVGFIGKGRWGWDRLRGFMGGIAVVM